jgi:hypothetical protein
MKRFSQEEVRKANEKAIREICDEIDVRLEAIRALLDSMPKRRKEVP